MDEVLLSIISDRCYGIFDGLNSIWDLQEKKTKQKINKKILVRPGFETLFDRLLDYKKMLVCHLI